MTTQSTPTRTGAAIEVGSRYTHVFQRENGDWRLLSARGTRIN